MAIETVALKAEKRVKSGSTQSVRLREAGKLPAVIYGHGQESVAIAISSHEFIEAIHHGSRLFDVNLDGKSEKILLKDLQYDYLGKNLIHADLMRVDLTEMVKVTVPVVMKGIAKGASEGGVVDEVASELEVQCVVTSIPDSITVSVKDMAVGDVIHAGDIKLPEGVKLLTPADQVVLTCHLVTVKTAEEMDAEAPTTPEVITEKKRDEDSDEKK